MILKSFNLLHNKSSFVLSQVEISSTCLKDVVSYLKIPDVQNNFKENLDAYWRSLFNINRYETRERKFAYTIYTDGKVEVLCRLCRLCMQIFFHEFTSFISIDVEKAPPIS